MAVQLTQGTETEAEPEPSRGYEANRCHRCSNGQRRTRWRARQLRQCGATVANQRLEQPCCAQLRAQHVSSTCRGGGARFQTDGLGLCGGGVRGDEGTDAGGNAAQPRDGVSNVWLDVDHALEKLCIHSDRRGCNGACL